MQGGIQSEKISDHFGVVCKYNNDECLSSEFWCMYSYGFR